MNTTYTLPPGAENRDSSKRIAELEQQLAELREALETISRLEPYDGDRHAYHIAGKVARAALQESDK